MPRTPLTKKELATVIENARRKGPTRVVVSADGNAVPPNIALSKYLLVPDVIFVRKDGWTLGAPTQFAKLAFEMWSGEWIEYFDV